MEDSHKDYIDAKRYRYLRLAKLNSGVWAAWIEADGPNDIDRIVDEHIQNERMGRDAVPNNP